MADTKPNIVLVSIDSLRADHCSCLGFRDEITPHMDALANDRTLFTRAISPATSTLPAHLSLFSGLYPFEYGVVDEGLQLGNHRR